MREIIQRCPKCGHTEITASRRRQMERLLRFVFPMSPYRCRECSYRFWVLDKLFIRRLLKILAFPLVLILVLVITLPRLSRTPPPPDPEPPAAIVGKSSAADKGAIPSREAPREKMTIPEKTAVRDEAAVPEKKPEAEQSDKKVLPVAARPEQPKAAKDPEVVSKPKKDVVMNLLRLERETSPKATKVRLYADRPVREYKCFFVSSPPRVVIDLRGKWKNMIRPEVKAQDDKIISIRVGQHPDMLRIVIDLKAKGPVSPVVEKTPQGLLVLIKWGSQ